MRGLFVTGTDTGVGKTAVAGAILAALRSHGHRPVAFKPVLTGLDDPVDPAWPRDHELLATAAGGGQEPDAVAPARFGAAASPHLAAALEGADALEPAALVAAAGAAGAQGDTLIVEGVGGLLVPLTAGYLVRDFALELELPLVVAARPGLGTINHTLLTLEAARATGLRVVAVVLTPWPDDPGPVERSNFETIVALGAVEVVTLPRSPAATRLCSRRPEPCCRSSDGSDS